MALAATVAVAAWGLARGGEAPRLTPAPAITVPAQSLDLVCSVRGAIRRVLVEEGDKVAKGQPLVELEAEVQKATLAISELRSRSMAQVDAAQANLKAKKAEFDREQALHKKGVASDADREKAELDFRYAECQLVLAKEQKDEAALDAARNRADLERMTVRAPVAGVILRKIADVGEAAVEDKPVIRLVVLDVIHVMAHVPPEVATRVRAGMVAQLVLNGAPNERHACRVAMVDPVVDGGSATCRVKLELPNPGHQVVAGSQGTVFFDLNPPAPK